MTNKLKLIGSIALLVLCFFSAIGSEAEFEGKQKIIWIIISSAVAVSDMFVSLIPCIFTQLSIVSSQIDPNRYSYKRSNFVDRKIIFNDIKKQIGFMSATSENIMWIRLYGEDGIGKKTLVSKLFQTYKYPFNKFYFIDDENNTSILNLMSRKYPLNNLSDFCDEIYMNNLARANRTFVIIEINSNDLTGRITNLLVNWCRKIEFKRKLILITLDRSSEMTAMKNQAVIFEYKLDRLDNEDSVLLASKLLKNQCTETETIVKAADGLPAAIKTLCDYYIKEKEQFESVDWIESFFRLKNDSKKAFLNFCLLSTVRKSFSQNIATEITDCNTVDFFINSSLLIKSADNMLYVPMWIVKTIMISGRYKEQLRSEIESLGENTILAENEREQIIALIENNATKVLEVLQCLANKKSLIQIKDFYSRLNMAFDINDDQHKQIIIIVMDALLKLGEYGLFKNEFVRYSTPISTDMSAIDFQLNMKIADYYHLTSQYAKSNEIYHMLSGTSLANYNENKIEIKFNLAHNFRHMGILDTAMLMFKDIEKTADHNSKFYIRSVTSRISIEYFLDSNFGADLALSELLSLPQQDEVKYNVFRHIANIYRRTEDNLDNSKMFLKEKISELNRLPLRIIYDYYFELAECYRQMCRKNIAHYNDAVLNYNYALIFAESNHDINLKLCAQLGKALVCYQKDKNKRALRRTIGKLLEDARISYVIYYGMLTILAILNNDSSIRIKLTEQKYYHYVNVLESHDINALHITVM